MPFRRSPSVSGRSFVIAITVAKTVTKDVMNVMAGLHTKGSLSAARVA
jgi:hypothetical protein